MMDTFTDSDRRLAFRLLIWLARRTDTPLHALEIMEMTYADILFIMEEKNLWERPPDTIIDGNT